jgi:UDP-N-acetylmuramyl pentapeptide phosphotransferase/UDP-N-acetylglucosamine-1-phosphate transferase
MWLLLAGSVGLLSWWLTGILAGKIAVLGPIDHPNDRSLHQIPTPRMGGVAMVASALAGIILATVMAFPMARGMTDGIERSPQVLWILGGMFFLAAVSFLDDRKGMPVWLRLSCHVFAASAVVVVGEVSLSSIRIPGWGEIALGWLATPITVMFLVWMTNLYNFMDGMDGFAGGMTVLGFGMMACLFWMDDRQLLFCLALVQAAAALGFLMHNFPPAKIFMGDVGSIPTGFLAGSVAVLGCRQGAFDFWVPLVIFSPFILDATVTLIHRALRGERVWNAHREHYYQRVVLSGWSHRRTVSVEYGVMVFCGLLALIYHSANEGLRLLILGVWMTVFVLLAGLVNKREVSSGH